MRIIAVIALVCLAACQTPPQTPPQPPQAATLPSAQPPAMMVFDTVVLNEQHRPHGWNAAIGLLAIRDNVRAEITQRRVQFWVSYPDAAQLAAAAEALHRWNLERSAQQMPRSTYEYHRIQYSVKISGKAVSGLALYSDPADLPPSVQAIRRAAIDQYILHQSAEDRPPPTTSR